MVSVEATARQERRSGVIGVTEQDVPVDVNALRRHFPALAGDTVLLENAGGSQVPACVSDAIREYMRTTYVQLGAGYEMSRIATATVDRAHTFINRLMNGEGVGKVILGSSSTVLCMTIADCYADVLQPGDEIVLAECGHEANIGPWLRAARRSGAVVKWWRIDRETTTTTVASLAPLLTARTRLICFPHVSNLLGEIVDVPAIVRAVRAASPQGPAARGPGPRIVVDGVAYAPHRPIDVAAWGVDWYFYSTYKVYGPHMGAMFGRDDAIAELTGPNHFFIPKDEVPYKFELGGASHEGCAGLLALQDYLEEVVRHANGNRHSRRDGLVNRETIRRAFELMGECEVPLQRRLIEFLRSKPRVRIIGPGHGEPSRVGTVSFVHAEKTSSSIAQFVNDRSIGIRHGHMYAHRLCTALGIRPEDGVVRVSLVHYNTIADLERLFAALNQVL